MGLITPGTLVRSPAGPTKPSPATTMIRNGKALRGKHTTCTELGGLVFDSAVSTGAAVSLGLIARTRRRSRGKSVKLSIGEGVLFCCCRAKSAVQEIRVYCEDLDAARAAIARDLRTKGITVR